VRDRLTITISDIHSTKSYNVHQIIKKVVFYVIFIGCVLIIGSGFSIWYLSSKILDIQHKKETLSSEYEKLQNENTTLGKRIREKAEEFQAISERIEDIEDLIGLKFDPNLNLDAKVDLASITVYQKVIALEEIPNGSPIEFKGITGNYGWRNHPILNRKEFHAGLDMRAEMRTPIYATANGVVEYSRFHKKSGYGKLVIVAHNYGFKTLYGHLDDIKVNIGDVVKKGDLIALTGNTGLSSGPHLHYEVKYLNMPLEPMNFINWNLKDYEKIFEKESKVKWQSLINLINNSNKVQQSSQKEQK
jgi:murein DD-endopeptidase MepM/ murein hydrolase activator NlpD